MSELKIDEKLVKRIAKEATHVFKLMIGQCDILQDKDKDLFERYMAFHKVGATMASVKQTVHLIRQAMIAGHDIQHEVFQTDAWEDGDWDIVKIETNDFFIDESDEDTDDEDCSDMPKELKELFKGLFK